MTVRAMESGVVPVPAIVYGPQWAVPFVSPRDQVLAVAREHADRIAIEDPAGSVSYRDLDIQSALCARAIVSNACTRSDGRTFVAVMGQRSARLVTALLGVWRAGGAYLPVDSSYPIERIRLLVDDANPAAVLIDEETTDPDVIAELKGREGTLLLSDVFGDGGMPNPGAGAVAIDPPIPGGSTAYVIYTSGSTGKPKGACITHRNVANLMSALSHTVGLTFLDRQGWSLKVSFDASVGELWPALSVGATVCAAPPEVETSLRSMLEWLESARVTSMLMGTALVNMLLGTQHKWWSELSLRNLLTGGDRLTRRPPPDLPFRFVNAYGPTECTVMATVGSTAPVARYTGGPQSPSIGTPIANCFVVILDEARRICNVGEPGELCIGGACVGEGYLGRPDLTGEKFIDDVYSNLWSGGKIYRTGDQALIQPDGNIRFLGRNDRQIAIHGFRVEAGEVEAALQASPAVEEVLVKRHDFPGLGPRMIAFITFKPGVGSDALEMTKAGTRSRLPAYMIPNQFVVLGEMPHTPNGKIDENALAPPERAREAAEELVQPADSTEEALCTLFAEVLSMSRLGACDDFFAWGGDSISAIELTAAIEEKFDVELDAGTLQAHPTPRAMAALLSGGAASDGGTDWEAESVQEPLRHRRRDGVGGRRAALVTGASGFIGKAVVQFLLDTDPDLVVMGMCRSERSALSMRAGVACQDPDRIEVVEGDLTRPGLGLDPSVWKDLTRRLSRIIHVGAEVNHVKSYAALRQANVNSTSELMQLAAESGDCPFVYVSSISTMTGDNGQVPEHPYSQSKWVSERRVAAVAGDLPVSVCRVARALPDRSMRWFNSSDTITVMLKASIACGGIPEFVHSEPATPVDVVAAALVSLSLEPRSAKGGVVGFAPMEVLHWSDLAARVRNEHGLEKMRWIDWISALKGEGSDLCRFALSLVEIAPQGMYMTDERTAIEGEIGEMTPVVAIPGTDGAMLTPGYVNAVADLIARAPR